MDIKLSCNCGAVEGIALNITPKNGNRVICCCDDCQKFAEHLQREADVLDEFGGTEVYQTSQSQVRITKGSEHLCSLRLTRKGLLRWYTDCCNTPVGNTINANFPFIGIIHSFLDIDSDRENVLGVVRAYVQTKHAHGAPNYPHRAEKFPLGITLRIMRMMLWWKIKGQGKPSAFFDESGKPVSKPKVLA